MTHSPSSKTPRRHGVYVGRSREIMWARPKRLFVRTLRGVMMVSLAASCGPTIPTPYDGIWKSQSASPPNCVGGHANFTITDGEIIGAVYALGGDLAEQSFRGEIRGDGTAFVNTLAQEEDSGPPLIILHITLKGDSFELTGPLACSHYAAFLGTRISKTVP
jgi:hypothetical protein